MLQLNIRKGDETNYCLSRFGYIPIYNFKLKKMKQLLSFVSNIFLYGKYFIFKLPKLRHDTHKKNIMYGQL
jgi:hypothetical protein